MLRFDGPQSEEDLALKQQLELYVERAQDSEEGIQRAALEAMRYTTGHSTGSRFICGAGFFLVLALQGFDTDWRLRMKLSVAKAIGFVSE